MRSPILPFFLLILRILFNLVVYKRGRFSKTLLKKGFEFVLEKKNSPISFFLGLILLLSKVDLILEKQSCKNDVLM